MPEGETDEQKKTREETATKRIEDRKAADKKRKDEIAKKKKEVEDTEKGIKRLKGQILDLDAAID